MMHRTLLILGCLGLVGQVSAASGDNKDKEKPAREKRVVVGRLFSPIGTLLVREKAKKAWTLPSLFDEVHNGDRLLALPGARGGLDLKEGDVHLTLLGNLPALTSGPVLECAAILHAGSVFDMDMTLERGRVMIENQRKQGPVKARFRVGEANVDVLLSQRESTVLLERHSRWLPGTPFVKNAKKALDPEVNLALLVVKGKAEVDLNGEKHTLDGPMLYHWSSHRGARGPIAIREVPKWLTPRLDQSPKTTAWHAAVEYLRRQAAKRKSLADAVANTFQEKDAEKRAVAVYSAAAIGDLALVLAALNDQKSAEVRRAAVLALDNFSGRGQSDDVRVYEALLGKDLFVPKNTMVRVYTPGQAGIVMQLLHGFSVQDQLQPETYETLIDYLQNKDLAIRELASWNLYQLVPSGKTISYDAAAAVADRGRAQAAWRKLIPAGQLPPRPKQK